MAAVVVAAAVACVTTVSVLLCACGNEWRRWVGGGCGREAEERGISDPRSACMHSDGIADARGTRIDVSPRAAHGMAAS